MTVDSIYRLQSGTYRLRYWNVSPSEGCGSDHTAAVGYLPFTVLKLTHISYIRSIKIGAAVGYLPFTVLKQCIINNIIKLYRCCSRVLTVYGIQISTDTKSTQNPDWFRVLCAFYMQNRRQAVYAWFPGGGYFRKVFLRRKLENEKAASGAIL